MLCFNLKNLLHETEKGDNIKQFLFEAIYKSNTIKKTFNTLYIIKLHLKKKKYMISLP